MTSITNNNAARPDGHVAPVNSAFLGSTSPISALVHAIDWSQTSLGPIARWSPILRTSVSMILQSPVPIITLWGPDGVMIYNDGYAVIAGKRHPHMLGMKVAEGWPEVADFNRHVMQVGLRGETLTYRDQYLVLTRSGAPEDTWFDLNYSPILDEGGTPIGVMAIVVETTRRMLEERHRQRIEQRFQLALDAGTIIGTWNWEAAKDRFTADERFARYFAIDPIKAIEGFSIDRIIAVLHPEHHAHVAVLLTQLMQAKGSYRAEYQIQQQDGAYRWIEVNAHCELSDEGALVSAYGVLIDIDERKASEQALLDSQEELQRITDEIPELVSYLDKSLTYRFANRGYEQWLGLTRGKIIGRPAHKVLGATYATHKPLFERALAGDEVVHESVLTISGRQRDIELRLFPRRSANSDVLGIYVFVLDIGDRKRAESALRRLNEGLEQQVQERTRERDRIWNVSSDLLSIADQNGIWLAINPAWRRTLGWAEEHIVGRTSEWMEHPDDRAKTRAEVTHLAQGHTTMHFENRFRTADGRYCWLSWTAVPEGNLLYCVARDITAEKERQAELEATQEQLRQAQKMEAIGQLTGGIAHDFNNLLTGIISALDLLQRRVAAGRINEIDRYVSVATTAAKRAASLTHRLLAFSRRQSLDVKPLDVNGLIVSLEDLLRRTMGESIALEVALKDGLWLAMTDANQLENALLNLCINARDAMPSGGKLTVETANTHLDETYTHHHGDLNPGEYVVISVSDTGDGMAPDVIARAFDPFFTTKPIGQGTGLGLSMIYGFVKQSGGHIRIYSEVSQGTTVKLYLPHLAAEDVNDDALSVIERPRAAVGECVLIVEDDDAVRMVIMEVLDDLGYQALEASDAATAIPQLESLKRIDLLVTDVGLPGMNGRQLAEVARQTRPDLPVLFVTGYAEGAAIRGGFLEPGMDMISKPFDLDVLATKIRSIIERE